MSTARKGKNMSYAQRRQAKARQTERNKVAKMKQIPIHELIEEKKLLFVDDSIVRGTQLKETVEFLYANGAKAVHMRSACPPIMYGRCSSAANT